MTNSWAAGWANGDIPTATEFAKGIGAIYNTTLGAAAASIDVTGIIAGYAHLMIVAYLRGDTAATSINATIRFNNDSGANYDVQRTEGQGATVATAESFGQTSARLGTYPAASATADVFGMVSVMVAHYAGSLDQKTFNAQFSHKHALTTGTMIQGGIAGFWRSAAAINRVTILPSTGNFDAGSRVTIYGMGG